MGFPIGYLSELIFSFDFSGRNRAFRALVVLIGLLSSGVSLAANSIQEPATLPPQVVSVTPPGSSGLPSNAPSAPDEIGAASLVANADASSNAFSVAMIGASLVVGAASFLLFVWLNTRRRSPRDWIWPLLPVVVFGYAMVFGPIVVRDDIYERWSDKCLNSEAAPTKRVPDPDSFDAVCRRAQVDHRALGYGALVEAYKSNILNGSEEMLYPRELKSLAWLLLVAWSGGIYFLLLTIRNRFFVR